jgi:hypothetical protein
MAAFYHQLPNVLRDIVDKNLHQLRMADVVTEFHKKDWLIRRLEILLQHYASEGRLRLCRCTGGKVGQVIRLLPADEEEELIGCNWDTFDKSEDALMNFWRQNGGVSEADPEYSYTDEDWLEYSIWAQDAGKDGDGDDVHCVRLMLHHLPNHSDFDELEDLDSSDTFLATYPGFLPIYVTLKKQYISDVDYPLTISQLSIKYGFHETARWMTRMMREAKGLTQGQVHDVFATIMEHLIMHPAILIHCPMIRLRLYQKLDEMAHYLQEQESKPFIGLQRTRSFHKKYNRIKSISEQLRAVLEGIKADPLYARTF